jgi:branched-chain amino acid transport system substrate-binding protein
MSKTTKIILGLIVAVIVIGGIWYSVNKNSGEEKTIKIGIVSHLSGELASYGVPMKNAAELAIEEINGKGGINGKKVELIIEDDNSDSNQAVLAMNKLVNIDKVNYVLSAQGSGSTSVIIPVAQNNKRVLMIVLGTAPGLTDAGDYIFRSAPSDLYQGVKMVDFIDNVLTSKKVAGLYINNTYGVGIKNIIEQDKNVENVASEIFEAGSTDFRTNLLKIKENKPDTLVLVAYREEFPTILKQIKELNLNVNIVTSETFNDEVILKNSGASAEGIITFIANPKDYVDFNKKYKEKFNEDPSAYSMYAYDGTEALLKAIGSVGDNPESVRNELSKVSFNGASGKVGFDEKRERTGVEYDTYIVKNGQFVPYGK